MSVKAVRSIVDREMRTTEKRKGFINISEKTKSQIAVEMFLAALTVVFTLGIMALCLHFSSAAKMAGIEDSPSVAVMGCLALVIAGAFLAVVGVYGISSLNRQDIEDMKCASFENARRNASPMSEERRTGTITLGHIKIEYPLPHNCAIIKKM